jgi:hypothetical protein
MITYFDEIYAQVWGDPSVPCVYTSIKKPLSKTEFEVVAKKQLNCVVELAKKNQELFSITDYTQCKGLAKEEAIDYMCKVVEREFRLGVTRKFFVRSQDKATRDSLIHGLVAASSLNFYVYDTISEVLNEISGIKTVSPPITETKSSRSISFIPKFLRNFFGVRVEVKL